MTEPESFETWNAKQHGDPEEIGFLQALRIAYCSGQDSVIRSQRDVSDFQKWSVLAYRALDDAGRVLMTVEPECFTEGEKLTELQTTIRELLSQVLVLNGVTTRRQMDEAHQFGRLDTDALVRAQAAPAGMPPDQIKEVNDILWAELDDIKEKTGYNAHKEAHRGMPHWTLIGYLLNMKKTARQYQWMLSMHYAPIAQMLGVTFGNYTPADDIINRINAAVDSSVASQAAPKELWPGKAEVDAAVTTIRSLAANPSEASTNQPKPAS